MMNYLSVFNKHPYAVAAVAVSAAELLRSRDCSRSMLTDGLTLVAIGTVVNAAGHAAMDGASMMGGAQSNPYFVPGTSSATLSARGRAEHFDVDSAGRRAWLAVVDDEGRTKHFMRSDGHGGFVKAVPNAREKAGARIAIEDAQMQGNPFTSPSGRRTGLAVVSTRSFPHGAVADILGEKRIKQGGRPERIVLVPGKSVGMGEVLVKGRHDNYHVIKRACGSKSGKPGRALAQGGYKGCDTRNAGRVLGLKSWRDSTANTRYRMESSLFNLVQAFKARDMPVPRAVSAELAVLKSSRTGDAVPASMSGAVKSFRAGQRSGSQQGTDIIALQGGRGAIAVTPSGQAVLLPPGVAAELGASARKRMRSAAARAGI